MVFAAACGRGQDSVRRGADGPADLLLRGGAVYTVDAPRSWATAVGVKGGRIIYVGSDSVPGGMIGPGTEVVDLAGRMVLPGFQDGHVHLLAGGVELGECTLFTLESAAAIADSITACAAARPNAPWVRGAGWELTAFPSANPSRALLDRIVARPAGDLRRRGRPLRLGEQQGARRSPGSLARRPIRRTAGSSAIPAPASRAGRCGRARSTWCPAFSPSGPMPSWPPGWSGRSGWPTKPASPPRSRRGRPRAISAPTSRRTAGSGSPSASSRPSDAEPDSTGIDGLVRRLSDWRALYTTPRVRPSPRSSSRTA